MSEKIKIKIINKNDKIKAKIFNQEVEIYNYISLSDIQKICLDIENNILNNNDIIDKYILLKLRFRQDVIELCTNIDTQDMDEDEIMNIDLGNMLYENIINLYEAEECIMKLYDKYILENTIGFIANNVPTEETMSNTVKQLSELFDNLSEDKIKFISDTIAWNNAGILTKKEE